MAVYLLHLDRPLAHARHYVGFAQNVEARVAHHRAGTGARFTQVLCELGIGFEVARVWPEGDKSFERRLKRQKHSARFCPHCSGASAAHNMPDAKGARP